MKESWVRPDMEVLDVKETAFGPQNPKMPDSDKTAVIGPNGEVIGWEQSYGENNTSALVYVNKNEKMTGECTSVILYYTTENQR